MEISLDDSNSRYIIRSVETGRIMVNDKTFTQNMVITPEKLIIPWDEQDFQALIDLAPEIVLLGTGHTPRWLPEEKLFDFYRKHIGVEVMLTASACRTFNILAAEGRKVAAGLIIQ